MSVMTRFAGVVLVGVLVVGGGSGIARAQEAKPEAKPDHAKIYNPDADADDLVAAAAAKARKGNTRILLMFGGDWCHWCHKLHNLFESDPEVRNLIRNEYVLVPIDLESPHADRLLRECKAGLVASGDRNVVGYPFLVVLDANRKMVTQQRTDPLEEGDHHDPKKVRNFLDRWKAAPLDAQEVLNAALARATEQDKRVFLHFGAPWCGWCHRLDDFLALQEIATILDRDFIDLKIDLDRMSGGKTVQAKFPKAGSGGIPWFAFLDAKGEVIVTSDGPNGNIGFPAKPDEINHFLAMLKKAARRIEPDEIEQIGKDLKETAERSKGS